MQGFDSEGIFSRHLVIVIYENLFTRNMEERRESHIGPSKERETPTLVEQMFEETNVILGETNIERRRKPTNTPQTLKPYYF